MNNIEIRKKNADYLTAFYSALNDVEDSDSNNFYYVNL